LLHEKVVIQAVCLRIQAVLDLKGGLWVLMKRQKNLSVSDKYFLSYGRVME